MMGDLGGGCLSQSMGGGATDHALCSQAIIRKQVGEVRRCKEKRKRRTDGGCGGGKRRPGLSLTVARDSEVVCAKAVLDV